MAVAERKPRQHSVVHAEAGQQGWRILRRLGSLSEADTAVVAEPAAQLDLGKGFVATEAGRRCSLFAAQIGWEG